MEEKVSIIIPVYNAEPYLEICLESVLKQDYPDIEVILIEDGSTDSCPWICDTYAERYANIKVLHQENKGAGMARNAGLSVASGKYICFVDADDCLDGVHAISTLVCCAMADDADIVTGSFRRLEMAGTSGVNYHHLEYGENTNTVNFRFKGFFQYGHLGFLWGKCYKKDFLDNYCLKCSTVPFTEDRAMNLCCCTCNPKYAFVSESVYLYRWNETSATSRYYPELAEIWVNTAEYLNEFLVKNKKQGEYQDMIAFHSCLGIFTVMRQELQKGSKKVRGIACKLKEYGAYSIVSRSMKELAKGKYVSDVSSVSWKLVIRSVAVIFTMHCYGVIAFLFCLLSAMQLDKKIIARKYDKEEK